MTAQQSGDRPHTFRPRCEQFLGFSLAALYACSAAALTTTPLSAPGALPSVRTTVVCTAVVLLMLGAISALLHRHRRARAPTHASLDAMRAMTDEQFRRRVEAGLEERGYDIKPIGRNQEGSDTLRATKAEKTILIYCSSTGRGAVSMASMQALHTSMMSEQATGGLAITGAALDPAARAFAVNKRIGIVEGGALLELVNRGITRKPSARREPYFATPVHELPDALMATGAQSLPPASARGRIAIRSEPSAKAGVG
ncbi:MAG: restriction endonuclease [Betaproteobacteria bacterium]